MSDEYNFGTLAFSKAGHDKGELYLILKKVGAEVFLVDGYRRKLDNPKRKNIKHIQPIFKISELPENPLTDENVKRYIKNYKIAHDL